MAFLTGSALEQMFKGMEASIERETFSKKFKAPQQFGCLWIGMVTELFGCFWGLPALGANSLALKLNSVF